MRGLHLDLAVSGDQRRVDAAMKRYIDTVTLRTDAGEEVVVATE